MKNNFRNTSEKENTYLVKLLIEGVNSAMQRCLDKTPGDSPRLETHFENPDTGEKVLLTVTFEARKVEP